MPDISQKSSPTKGTKNKDSRSLGVRRKGSVSDNFEEADQSAIGGGINLIDQGTQKKASASERSMRHIIEAFFIALGISLIAYGGLYAYQFVIEGDLAASKKEMDAVNTSIAQIESRKEEIVRFDGTLRQLKRLLGDRSYWSSFFGQLEKNTVSEVSYVSMVSDASSNISLTGIAKDYTSLGRQLRLMQDAKDFAVNPTISGASSVLSSTGEAIGVNFSLTFSLNKDTLKR